MDLTTARRPTFAQVLLGLFVTWQLIFLLAANLLSFFPYGEPQEGELSDSRRRPAMADSNGPVQDAINGVTAITRRWEYWTGQVQVWSLFAPTFPTQASFPVVELRWQDEDRLGSALAHSLSPLATGGILEGPALWAAAQQDQTLPPVRLRSVFEPEDRHEYFRPPGSFDRFFHYEMRLGLILLPWGEIPVENCPDEWRRAIEDRVRRQRRSLRAYLQWRVRQFQQEHPELPPPKQAVLSMRLYRTPLPGHPWVWQTPLEQPLARWRCGTAGADDGLPIEMCDPVSGKFVGVRRKP
jgi:hypothetical protein